MRLKDRVVVVTGGAHNIGRTYVRRLVQEGARVVVADLDGSTARSVAEEVGGADGRAIGVETDVSDPGSVETMVRRTLDTFGRVDVLVNNAALFSALARRPIDEIPVDEWDRVMAVNVRGPFLCSKAVIPHMRRVGKGKIVNIASGIILSAMPNFLHYVASKGAVFAMTRALAREVGRDGITVNSLAPGFVVTEATLGQERPETVAAIRQSRALARDEVPEDLEGALVFLASDDSDFVTGQMLVVNGGAQFW